MTIINPSWSASRQAVAQVKRGLWAERSKIKAIEYLDAQHEYKLCENQHDTGIRVVLLGAEAKAINDHFRDEFRAEINRVYPAKVSVPMKALRVAEFNTTKPNTGTAALPLGSLFE